MLVASGMLAEHPLREEQQHEQPDRERRLHDDERREQQRDHLKRPAGDREPGADQPARALGQPPRQRESQVLVGRRLLGVERLDRDP